MQDLVDRPFEKLLKIKGMRERKVYLLVAAIEFAKRWVGRVTNMLKYNMELRIEVLGSKGQKTLKDKT